MDRAVGGGGSWMVLDLLPEFQGLLLQLWTAVCLHGSETEQELLSALLRHALPVAAL